MSTKLSSRKKNLEFEYNVWVRLVSDDGRVHNARFWISGLHPDEQERINQNIAEVTSGIYHAIAPHLSVEYTDNPEIRIFNDPEEWAKK